MERGGYKFRDIKSVDVSLCMDGAIDSDCPADCEQDEDLLLGPACWDKVVEADAEDYVDVDDCHSEDFDNGGCCATTCKPRIYSWQLKDDFHTLIDSFDSLPC